MPEAVLQEQELKQEALTVTQKAALVQITDQTTYDGATSLLLEQIIPFRKKWAEYWGPLKESAWAAHKAVMAKFNAGDEPAAQAERVVKTEIARWDNAQRKLEEERQRQAQEEAERQEQEDRLAIAVAAEKSGASKAEVDQIIEAPVQIIARPVAPAYVRASGVSTRETWRCEVLDIKKLCLAVAKGQISSEYVLPNQAALNARAKADKKTLNIPGCVARNESVVAGRTK